MRVRLDSIGGLVLSRQQAAQSAIQSTYVALGVHASLRVRRLLAAWAAYEVTNDEFDAAAIRCITITKLLLNTDSKN